MREPSKQIKDLGVLGLLIPIILFGSVFISFDNMFLSDYSPTSRKAMGISFIIKIVSENIIGYFFLRGLFLVLTLYLLYKLIQLLVYRYKK